MRKPRIIFLILVVVVAVIAAYMLLDSYFMEDKPKTPQVKFPSEENNVREEVGNTVVISDFRFHPDTLTIKVGDEVVWINEDGAVHTASSPVFDSANIKNTDSFKFQFTEAGTYEYICNIHPHMRGTIIVQ